MTAALPCRPCPSSSTTPSACSSLGLQADELSLGEEAWTNLRKATESVSTERFGAWIDLAWEAWGKSKGALLKPEALTTLTDGADEQQHGE